MIETRRKSKQFRIGRLQFGWVRYLHSYGGDQGFRWVFKPWFLFDYGRKKK